MFRSQVLICGGTGCTSSGSDEISKVFEQEVAKADLQDEVKIVRTGCFGLCALGPIVILSLIHIYRRYQAGGAPPSSGGGEPGLRPFTGREQP